MSYKCLIIDDEPPAIALIRKHLSLFGDFEIVGECHSAVKAFEIIKKNEIDLIFLDIQMPMLTGLDFLKSLQNPPMVIFTTAYREYAVEGYDLDIVDYLLKPISFARFVKAIDRFYLHTKTPVQDDNPIIKNIPKSHFFVNINKKSHKIVFADILYIESLKDYVRIHTLDKQLVVKSNIGNFLKKLPSQEFIRIHRSFIIPISKITAYSSHDVELGDVVVPIGASYKKDLVGKFTS